MKTLWIRYKKSLFWIGLGLLALLIRFLLAGKPDWIETYYSRRIFVALRSGIDVLAGLFPIPLIYPFIALLVFDVGRRKWKWLKTKMAWSERLLSGLFGILGFLGGVIFFFLFLWGYNYGRLSLESQLGLQPQALSLEELKEELDIETEKLIAGRAVFGWKDSVALTDPKLIKGMEAKLRAAVERWLSENGYPVAGEVRGRYVYPKGIFLHFGSSGLYFPFTGEGHIDAGLTILQKPYVMAHEMSHGYGFGDEGTCNFIAYVSCIHSDDPFLAYIGHLSYWRTLATNYLSYKPDEYRSFRATLPLAIQADLDAINVNLLAYPDIMPALRDAAYEAYLKSQGIEEGMKNYNRVIMLARAWRLKGKLG
ncbi:MAG TPA: DUF3810 domain-containing protein [Saprospiraceae bacterium]|nr:DUF3810 domain-containing protein [Saprospiraceae bacterium]HMQ84582.1 DUF3810 domain-containing protein [Saprospiraceae bacterium]